MIDKEKKDNNIRYLLENKYNRVKFEITCLETKKNILKDDCYDTNITPNYSGLPSGKGGTSDKVFDRVVKTENDIERIDKQLANKKAFINTIDELVSNLGWKQQAVVKKRAFEHKDYNTIAKELRDNNIEIYNSHYCYEMYAKSCKSMQDLIDGSNIDLEVF